MTGTRPVYRGANTKIEADDLPHQAFAGRDLVYVANLSNQSANCYPLVVEHAKAAGTLFAVNPGVRQLTARFDDFWHSLKSIDILCVNRAEAQTLMPRLLQSFGDGGAPLICQKRRAHSAACQAWPAQRRLRNVIG